MTDLRNFCVGTKEGWATFVNAEAVLQPNA